MIMAIWDWLYENSGPIVFAIVAAGFLGLIGWAIYDSETDPEFKHLSAERKLHKALHDSGRKHNDIEVLE